MKFVFVGEKRSARAIAMGVRWTDGRLAARSLFQALASNGIDPTDQRFVNLFLDGDDYRISGGGVRLIRQLSLRLRVVALGRRVADELTRLDIAHRSLVHPAARGAIRRRDRYHSHVRDVLGAWGPPVVAP